MAGGLTADDEFEEVAARSQRSGVPRTGVRRAGVAVGEGPSFGNRHGCISGGDARLLLPNVGVVHSNATILEGPR
jgi:hypothetical protein